jgi:hypothetical protein
MSKLLEKSWIPASARVSTTFNAPGNLSIPYGRYSAKITGRGAPGNAPNAATWNTNYNVTYPVGNQPVTGDNSAYQWLATQLVRVRCGGGWASAPISYYPYAQIITTDNLGEFNAGINSNTCVPGFSPWSGGWQYFSGASYPVTTYAQQRCLQIHGNNAIDSLNMRVCQASYVPGNPNYSTNYNTVYPIGNRPIASYNAANAGTPANILGVSFPGGIASNVVGSPNPASVVANTAVNYWQVQDNVTTSISVPSGGTVTVTLE